MPHERVARGLALAGDDVEHAGREDVRGDLGEAQRAQRRELGRLEHDRVAGRERGPELPGRHVQRVVPRRDRADDAERVAAHVADVWSSRYSPAARPSRKRAPAGEEAPVVDGEVHLELDDRRGLAAVLHLEALDRVEVGLDRVGDLVQDLAAAPRGHRATTRRTRPRRPRPRRRRPRRRSPGPWRAPRRSPGSGPRRWRRSRASRQLPPMKFWSGMELLPLVRTVSTTMLRCATASRARDSVAIVFQGYGIRAEALHRGDPSASLGAHGAGDAHGSGARRGTGRRSADRGSRGRGRRRHLDRPRHEAIRRLRRGRRRALRDPPRRVLLDARPVRLRQDDDAADDRRLRAAVRGRDPARGQRRLEGPAVQAQRQHRVPAVRAVPAHVGEGQRRVRAEGQEGGEAPRSRSGSASCSRSSASATSPTASRRSSPAASSSGSRSPGRS